MCHDIRTQERFYALHKNLSRAKQMRDLFVRLAQREPSSASSSSDPAAGSSSSSAPAAGSSSSCCRLLLLRSSRRLLLLLLCSCCRLLLLPRSSWLHEEEASAICHAEDGPEGEGEKGDFSKKELPRVHQETVNPS